MNKLLPTFFAVFLAACFSACATARPAGSAPDTDVGVVDEGGGSVPGAYDFWSPQHKDSCDTSGSGCSVSLPEGEYNLTFHKERGGRMASAGGSGSVGGTKESGCLRSRVHLIPGKEISCKKVAEYNCNTQAVETMDCGTATIAHYTIPATAK